MMDAPTYIPSSGEARWTPQPWGEQPVMPYSEEETQDWLEVSQRAQEERLKAAREQVKLAYEAKEREQDGQ